MGLVKTRRLAAMRKQTTYAKATVVKQRAKVGLKSRSPKITPPLASSTIYPRIYINPVVDPRRMENTNRRSMVG